MLTEEKRRALFGVPEDRDSMVRLYTLSRADLDLGPVEIHLELMTTAEM